MNNVLDARNQPGWDSVQDNNPTMGPELLLDNAEDFGLFFATSLDNDTSVTIARDNIGISISNNSLFIEEMEAILLVWNLHAIDSAWN